MKWGTTSDYKAIAIDYWTITRCLVIRILTSKLLQNSHVTIYKIQAYIKMEAHYQAGCQCMGIPAPN